MTCKCARKCHMHFRDSSTDEIIKKARKPMFDANMERAALRDALKENWRQHLTLPDGKPCCTTMATNIFACSRSFLYPDKRPKQTRSEASSVCPKATMVSSWFFNLRKELDVFPDSGWFMVNQPRRRYVFESYCEDARTWPSLYMECSRSYFNEVWRTQFPEIRLRKHCVFTKCPFCVEHRERRGDRSLSADARAEAKQRLKLHIAWAHKRERGLYMDKVAQAQQEPHKYISIAIDATEKFPHGFPHFFETTKDTDGTRLKVHVVIAMVHGSRPRVYLGWENLKSDPNLVCEVLTRTLQAEETLRGALPPTLYLQTDNCIRENKNTYLEKFIEWLAERRVLKSIFGSFLPIGHTHFDCDQFASRIGEATKHRDITSIDQLIKVIEDCYSPTPTVEFIHDVLDWRALLNPTLSPDFPVATARCRRARGLCTKVVLEERRHFMAEGSPLHWWVRTDHEGCPFLQTKSTVDDDAWSEAIRHWDTKAPRPDNRECHMHKSGLLPSDLKFAPRRAITDARYMELQTTIGNAKNRLSQAEFTEFTRVYEELHSPPSMDTLSLPDHGWAFKCESTRSVVADSKVNDVLRLPRQGVFHNLNEQNQARENRKIGVADEVVVIGKFVAILPNYKNTVPVANRNEFWLGKVIEIDQEQKMVHVRYWHTGVKKNASGGGNASYRQ